MPVMTIGELEDFFAAQFPHLASPPFRIVRLEDRAAELRLFHQDRHLRPGGTVSGPTMMMLADTAMYVLVLAALGPVALAVTTNLNINFLRKPAPGDLIARGRLLKLGSRLAVGEIGMYSDGEAEPVAHATVTYSIPPRS
jgi:uncharacterized protein (TIGR00369 family)